MFEKWQGEYERAKDNHARDISGNQLTRTLVEKGQAENTLSHILRILSEISELEKECAPIFEARKNKKSEDAYNLQKLKGEQKERRLSLQHDHEREIAIVANETARENRLADEAKARIVATAKEQDIQSINALLKGLQGNGEG